MTLWWHSDDTLMTLWWHSEHTLNTLWTHSERTLMTLWWHSDDTLYTLWTHSEHTLNICLRFDNISKTLPTDSPTWIQEMLAHLKSVTKPPLDLRLVYWTSIATYGNSKHLSRKVSPGRSQNWDQPVVPKLPKFILAHPCKQLAVTLHNQPTDHIWFGRLFAYW